MVDDHEGDIQIARLCFAKSRLSNPWLSFTDSLDALSYLRIAAHDPQKVPGLLLVEMHMGMMDGFTFLERASAIHGGTLPCPAVLLTHPALHKRQHLVKQCPHMDAPLLDPCEKPQQKDHVFQAASIHPL